MSQRFFSEAPITGDTSRLTGDEVRHLAAVMRAKVGDELIMFDGSGAEFVARITRLAKREAELEIVERREISREAACHVTLAVALPKGERQRWLIEKAVEIGVAALIPLATARGVAEAGSGALERMRRWVIEASKQCGRNRLLEIASPCDVADLGDCSPGALCLCAHSGGEPLGANHRVAERVLMAIGPEGGFTEDEVGGLVAKGFTQVNLGPRILRVETAAIALSAQWLIASAAMT